MKHELFEKNNFKLCNRLIDRLYKGYDESKRDTLSRQLVHDPSQHSFDQSVNPEYSAIQGRREATKHKRSVTTIADANHTHHLNNSSSVDIRIDSEKGNSPVLERENPGPGSSRRDS